MLKYAAATLLLLASNHLAASAETAIKAPDASQALVQTLIGLALVVMVILALAWFARRFNLGGLQGQKHFTTLAVLPLGAREKAVLVDVAGQQILLGVAPGRISSLHVFETPVVTLAPEAPKTPARVGEGDFAKKLAEILRQSVGGERNV